MHATISRSATLATLSLILVGCNYSAPPGSPGEPPDKVHETTFEISPTGSSALVLKKGNKIHWRAQQGDLFQILVLDSSLNIVTTQVCDEYSTPPYPNPFPANAADTIDCTISSDTGKKQLLTFRTLHPTDASATAHVATAAPGTGQPHTANSAPAQECHYCDGVRGSGMNTPPGAGHNFLPPGPTNRPTIPLPGNGEIPFACSPGQEPSLTVGNSTVGVTDYTSVGVVSPTPVTIAWKAATADGDAAWTVDFTYNNQTSPCQEGPIIKSVADPNSRNYQCTVLTNPSSSGTFFYTLTSSSCPGGNTQNDPGTAGKLVIGDQPPNILAKQRTASRK